MTIDTSHNLVMMQEEGLDLLREGPGPRPVLGLIVGNGFTIDAWNHLHTEIPTFNPSRPLSWDVFTPGTPATPLLKALPYFSAALEAARDQAKGASDFELFRQVWARYGESDDLRRAVIEARHYLAIAYSQFQAHLDQQDLAKWAWQEWFHHYGRFFSTAVSFNYDLLLEDTLRRARIRFVRPFASRFDQSSVFKPHGSIDYEGAMPAMLFGTWGTNQSYPLKAYHDFNDGPIRELERNSLLAPRNEPLTVLPNEQSAFIRFRWVMPGYHRFMYFGSMLTHCVVVGYSHGLWDQDEGRYLLRFLDRRCKVYVADPSPSSALLAEMDRLKISCVHWKAGPESL